MAGSPFPSDDAPEPSDVLDWLAIRESEVAELTTAALDRIVVGAFETFVRSMTAAGDLTALDTIPNAWLTFVNEELVDELGDTYLAGSMTAWLGLKSAPTQKYAESWAAVVNQAAVTYQQQATNRLVGVGQTTWEMVRKQTVQAVKDGLTHDQLSAKVRDVTEFSKHRADTIARTEVNSAFINGDMAGAEALGDYGPAEKVWKATPGPRTRPSHSAADDQCVPFDQPFEVGGIAMTSPHAAGAPASEVVNCRCYVAFLYPGDTRPDGTVVPEPETVPAPQPVTSGDDADAIAAQMKAQNTAEVQAMIDAQKASKLPTPKPPKGAKQAVWEPDSFDFQNRQWTKPANQPNLGGVHRKWVIDTPDGQYLVKPGELHVIKGEAAATAIARRAGIDVPEVMIGRVEGEWVSVQKMVPNARTGFPGPATGFDPTKVTAKDIQTMQDHRALDWVVGNHDNHAGQWVREGYAHSGGKLIGVDKGQAFKMYGRGEKLSFDYNPNGGGGFAAPVHNFIESSYSKGILQDGKFISYADEAKPWKVADALKAIPDDEFRAMLRPYAEGRFRSPGEVEKFLDDMTARKNNVRTDFAAYHKTLDASRNKALGIVPVVRVPLGEVGGPSGMHTAVPSQADTNWMRANDSPLTSRTKSPTAAAYTGSSYRAINNAARAGTIGAKQKALSAELGTIKTDMILHRGTTLPALPPGGVRALEGAVLVDGGFMSTSAGGTAAFGGEASMVIKATAGTRGSYVKPISLFPGENEVVLDRGQHLYVHKVYQQGSRWILEMETVSPEWAAARDGVRVWDPAKRAWRG